MKNHNVVHLDGSNFEAFEAKPLAVVFRNRGEIDMRAVRTMGISAKEPGAIGFFGTGLKYAIAVLMRENQELVIWSGTSKHTFQRKDIEFRGKSFEVILMDGEELPFTTELGKTWEMWQAFRELYCNCTDEDGEIAKTETLEGEAGWTTIVATGQKVLDAYEERAVTILQSERWTGDENVSVSRGATNSIFYKGIKVLTIPPAVNTYNILKPIDLTEDRTLKYWWQARGRVMNAVLRSTNREFIRSVLGAPKESYEGQFNFLDKTEATALPTDEFIEVCESLYRRVDGDWNQSAAQLALQHRQRTIGDAITGLAKLSENKQAMLERAKEFCGKIGYTVTYPVVVTDVLGENVLGLAEGEKIYLNLRVFAMGTKMVARTLIEEQIHLQKGLLDETREMQNYLFERVIDLSSELHGEVL